MCRIKEPPIDNMKCLTCETDDVKRFICRGCRDDCCNMCCAPDGIEDNRVYCAKCEECIYVDADKDVAECDVCKKEGEFSNHLCSDCECVWEWSRRRGGYITKKPIVAKNRRRTAPRKFILKLKGGKVISKTEVK
jgi:hypothetical protein